MIKKIRVLVVDAQTIVREGVVTVLSFQPDFDVVGDVPDGDGAIQFVRQNRVDVILLDVATLDKDGFSVIPLIKKYAPQSSILVLTSAAESEMVYKAIKSGAKGYMLKDATSAQLLKTIKDVFMGKTIILSAPADTSAREASGEDCLVDNGSMLTRREYETLKLIAQGMRNHEIAAAMTVSERTVAKYVSCVLKKLHATNRTQAALMEINENAFLAHAF